MILPSKELISKVLSKEVEEERFVDSNSLTYVNSGIYEDINIYELVHKCKEWALSKGYDTRSGFNSYLKCYFCDIYKDLIHQARYEYATKRTSEPEAIFKACEWIMEQTKCGS